MVNAAINGIGTAFPPGIDQESAWERFFSSHYAASPLASRIWRNSGVARRHVVVDPRAEDISAASTATRMRRFVDEALPLGKDAVTAALAAGSLSADDIDLFAVVSCTGYATPGVDTLLARDLGMPASVERLHLGHMGCFAALPALAAVADAAVARGKTGMLLCVELASLHLQPPPTTSVKSSPTPSSRTQPPPWPSTRVPRAWSWSTSPPAPTGPRWIRWPGKSPISGFA